MRECSRRWRSQQRSHLRSQRLPSGHPVDQAKDLQPTARCGRLTRDQVSLALPVACTRATQIGPKPSLTSANAAKSDAGALSWQLVLTHRQASPLLTGDALTCGWAQLVSNQRPLACKASALPLSYAPAPTASRRPASAYRFRAAREIRGGQAGHVLAYRQPVPQPFHPRVHRRPADPFGQGLIQVNGPDVAGTEPDRLGQQGPFGLAELPLRRVSAGYCRDAALIEFDQPRQGPVSGRLRVEQAFDQAVAQVEHGQAQAAGLPVG